MGYISVDEAVDRPGLRLVISSGAPGPWGEGAKALFDVKGIDYIPVEQHAGTEDPALFKWTGQYAAPAAMYEKERPRTRWYEILALAERLAPELPLTPENEEDRLRMTGFMHEICAEDGLGWNFRTYFIEAQTSSAAAPQSDYGDTMSILRARYVQSFDADYAVKRMRAIITSLADQWAANRARGSRYLIGDQLTALDLYWVTFSSFFVPIAHEHCPMTQGYRDMGHWMGSVVGDALDPRLIEQRDRILVDHFKLPMWF